jgi:hypothetical protein
MQTILTVALGTIFPKENIKSIMEVIGATPNPEIATQILLGIYKEPVIQSSAVYNDRDCYFIKYDKWSNLVHYWYMEQATKNICIAKDTDKTLITEENYETFKVSYDSKDSVYHTVKLSTKRKVESSCDLGYWIGKPMVEISLSDWEEAREMG